MPILPINSSTFSKMGMGIDGVQPPHLLIDFHVHLENQGCKWGTTNVSECFSHLTICTQHGYWTAAKFGYQLYRGGSTTSCQCANFGNLTP